MQSHVDIKVPTIELYGTALEKFLAAGYEVQITELDVTINYDTNGSFSYADEKETNADQAKYVGQLMKTILEKNRDYTTRSPGVLPAPHCFLTRESRIRKLLSMNLSTPQNQWVENNITELLSPKIPAANKINIAVGIFLK